MYLLIFVAFIPGACSIMGVDPSVHLCNNTRLYIVYENVPDCAAKCAAETNFTCQGFVWMGRFFIGYETLVHNAQCSYSNTGGGGVAEASSGRV